VLIRTPRRRGRSLWAGRKGLCPSPLRRTGGIPTLLPIASQRQHSRVRGHHTRMRNWKTLATLLTILPQRKMLQRQALRTDRCRNLCRCSAAAQHGYAASLLPTRIVYRRRRLTGTPGYRIFEYPHAESARLVRLGHFRPRRLATAVRSKIGAHTDVEAGLSSILMKLASHAKVATRDSMELQTQCRATRRTREHRSTSEQDPSTQTPQPVVSHEDDLDKISLPQH
jgi:hypothetical protein